MKKKLHRLRLDRETLRHLTPEHLDQVAGGDLDDGDTRHNSCNFAEVSKPLLLCITTIPFICL